MSDGNKYGLPEERTDTFHEIIDLLPFPLAIFDRSLAVTLVNKAFRNAANINDPLPGTVRINRDRIDDPQLAASFMKVFKGDAVFSEKVRSPFSMFSGIERKEDLLPGFIYRVEVSPFSADNTEITHGVIVIIQKKV